MNAISKIFHNLNENDKVTIVYGENADMFNGYVDSITEKYLTIHEYVPDIYRTFYISEIIEIFPYT